MSSAKLIERSIPDELRLAPHPDAALVNEAIATVLTAMDESDALTLAGKSRDVRKALLAFYNGTYVKHIAEEDELWTSMQAKAEKYRPEAHLITTRPMKGGFSRYSYTMDNEKGTVVVMMDEGKYVAEYMVFGTDIPVASAAMDSEREALASLFIGRGALVVIDGTPLIPLPAKVPVIEETATKTVTEEPANPPIAEESEGAKAVRVERLIEEWDEFIRNEGTDFTPFNRKIRSMVDPATAQDIIDGQNTKFLRLMKQAFAAKG